MYSVTDPENAFDQAAEENSVFLPTEHSSPVAVNYKETNGSDRVGTGITTNEPSRTANRKIPKRYIFSLIGFVACSLAVNFNTNLSIAIVSMVNRNTSVTHVRNSNECMSEEPPHTMFEYIENTEYAEVKELPGEFYWDTNLEGLAIAAAYYGQLLGFIPGGRMAELFGGKRVLIASISLASFLTVLLPAAAYWSVYAFVALRFLIGVGTAPAIPVLFYLIAKWIPTTERSIHASIILAGYGIGSFAGFIGAGALCDSSFLGGWPSVFYSGGAVGLIWCVFCYFFMFETPLDHPSITSNELHYILQNINTHERKKIPNIPWKEMACSLPLWSLAMAYFGQFWILGFFCTAHALYMGTILNLSMVKNGQLSCLPHLIRAVFACVCSFPADYALRRGWISIDILRKGATTLNTVVSCVGFIGIVLVGCGPVLNTVLFTVGGLLGDFVTFGVCMACVDIAPDLSGTVSGILNIIGVIPFFVIPTIIGWLTRNERTMGQWNYIFYYTIAIAVGTNILYLICGTSKPQPWGVIRDESSPFKSNDSTRRRDSKQKDEIRTP